MFPARTLTTSALQPRSSMSCSPESMGGEVDPSAAGRALASCSAGRSQETLADPRDFS